jgi:hypothetical protein
LESDDQSGPRPEIKSGSASSLGGASSENTKRKKKRSSRRSTGHNDTSVQDVDTPSLADMKSEEQRAALEEEAAIARRRLAAHELALSRGLDARGGDKVRN